LTLLHLRNTLEAPENLSVEAQTEERCFEIPIPDPYSAAGYRLPTEAEWEYACRAGTTTALYIGPLVNLECSPVDDLLDQVAWYCGNTNYPHAVKLKIPNAYGLFDMHGNVYEWCNDRMRVYSDDPATDPIGGDVGGRVKRSGSQFTYWAARACRSAYRESQGTTSGRSGFRVARTAF